MCHTRVMRALIAVLSFSIWFFSIGLAQPPIAPGTPQRPAPGTPAPPEPKDQKDDGIIRVQTNVVIAPTTILDKHGDYVNGLAIDDFQLFDNGKLQKITADVSYQPLSLLVAVQASNNLQEVLPKIQRIGLMLDELVAGQNGEVAVLAFDHRVRVMQEFTSEGARVAEAMKKITPGSTNHRMIDAVVDGVRMLRKRPDSRRKVLLLISEKRDQSSSGKLREALTDAQLANVAIYSLDISSVMAGLTSKAMPPRPQAIPAEAQHMPAGGAATPTTMDQQYNNGNAIPLFVEIFKNVKSIFVDDALDVFTRYTGGKQYSFIKEKALERAVTALGEELHSQYLLSYTPNNLSEGGFHEIKVVVNRPSLEVRTRPGYWVAGRPE
jgi:VWFA-related protein